MGNFLTYTSTLRYSSFGSRVGVVYYALGTMDTTENRDSQGPCLYDLDYGWQTKVRGGVEMEQ